MPRRRKAGAEGSRVALLHALAHIEFNAIDLAWDLIARFESTGPGFYDDWVRVVADETRHHGLLLGRLASDARSLLQGLVDFSISACQRLC
jgi:uncharacterized ferritin-like protein (DUF455 family)